MKTVNKEEIGIVIKIFICVLFKKHMKRKASDDYQKGCLNETHL
jgi:hypothetical protein